MTYALKRPGLDEEMTSTQGNLINYKGGRDQMLPNLLGQERKFTFKWESREMFLGKDMVKLDLKNGFNLDTGKQEVEEARESVSLQDPPESQSGSWLPQGQLQGLVRNLANLLSASPSPYSLSLLSPNWSSDPPEADGQGHVHAVSQARGSTFFSFLAHLIKAEEAPHFQILPPLHSPLHLLQVLDESL